MSLLDRDHYEGNILDETEAIEARVAALERTELSGVAGPPGPTGPQGPIGSPGPGAPAPLTQGDILVVDAVPIITTLAVGTARDLLQTNAAGTDPEWTDAISVDTILAAGNVTLDDGVSDSPHLIFIGGTNDDQIDIYLDDNAGVGTSILKIKLCDAGGLSDFVIVDSALNNIFQLNSDGKLFLVNDVTLDDGAGDSPILKFVGGSNNDVIQIFLDDDAAAGKSDLVIKLCDAAADSRLEVQDSTGVVGFWTDTDGKYMFRGHGDILGDLTVGSSGVYSHTDIYGDFTLHLTASIEIVAGVFTPIASFSMVDSEGAVGADDLVTINDSWGSGAILIFRSASTVRDITFKDGTGNMQLKGDCILGSIYDRIGLIKTYTWWVELFRCIR